MEAPVSAKSAPVMPIWEIVTDEPPEFVTISDICWLLPTCAVPKLRLVALAAKPPGVAFALLAVVAGLPELNPWQPTIARHRMSSPTPEQ